MILLLLMFLLFLSVVFLILDIYFAIRRIKQSKKLAYNLLVTRGEMTELKKTIEEAQKRSENA